PLEIDEWFAKACHRDPEKRFQTPREMAEALWLSLGVSKPPTSRAGFGVPRSAPDAVTEAMTTGTLRSTIGSRATVPPVPSRLRWVLVGAALLGTMALSGWALSVALEPTPTVERLQRSMLGAARATSLVSGRLSPLELTPKAEPADEKPADEMPVAKPTVKPARPTHAAPAPKPKPAEDDLGF
ncbi:MAG TPA: hypothetical protein PKD61_09380, partial [Polyangiaceae bacterium]|nr:hypothetical protein [Polyangiaceae bacterium]